jgi:hypothetical protein
MNTEYHAEAGQMIPGDFWHQHDLTSLPLAETVAAVYRVREEDEVAIKSAPTVSG